MTPLPFVRTLRLPSVMQMNCQLWTELKSYHHLPEAPSDPSSVDDSRNILSQNRYFVAAGKDEPVNGLRLAPGPRSTNCSKTITPLYAEGAETVLRSAPLYVQTRRRRCVEKIAEAWRNDYVADYKSDR